MRDANTKPCVSCRFYRSGIDSWGVQDVSNPHPHRCIHSEPSAFYKLIPVCEIVRSKFGHCGRDGKLREPTVNYILNEWLLRLLDRLHW